MVCSQILLVCVKCMYVYVRCVSSAVSSGVLRIYRSVLLMCQSSIWGTYIRSVSVSNTVWYIWQMGYFLRNICMARVEKSGCFSCIGLRQLKLKSLATAGKDLKKYICLGTS